MSPVRLIQQGEKKGTKARKTGWRSAQRERKKLLLPHHATPPPLTCREVLGVTITFKRHHQFSALCIVSANAPSSSTSLVRSSKRSGYDWERSPLDILTSQCVLLLPLLFARRHAAHLYASSTDTYATQDPPSR